MLVFKKFEPFSWIEITRLLNINIFQLVPSFQNEQIYNTCSFERFRKKYYTYYREYIEPYAAFSLLPFGVMPVFFWGNWGRTGVTPLRDTVLTTRLSRLLSSWYGYFLIFLLIFFQPIVICNICKESFHEKCANIPKSKFSDDWYCSSCKGAFRLPKREKGSCLFVY